MIRHHRTGIVSLVAGLAGSLLLACGAAAASGEPAPGDPDKLANEAKKLELARVEGDPITLSEIQHGFGARHAGHGSLLAGREILREVLDKAIDERLVIVEGYRMGLENEPAVLEAVDAYRDIALLREMEQREFQEAARPTDAEVQKVYEGLKVQRRVFLIQTPSEEKARAARKRLEEGEAFDAVARSISVHRTRTRGGDLGWVSWGRLAPGVEEVVFGVEVGVLVGPLAAEGNWHVVRVEEEREATPPELSRVSSQIREIMRKRNKDRLFREMLREIREKHPPVENEEGLRALQEGAPAADGPPHPPDETVLLKTATGLELTAGRVRQRAAAKRLPMSEAWRKSAVDTLLIDEARRRIKPDQELERKIEVFAETKVRREVEKLALAGMPDLSEKSVRSHYESRVEQFRTPSSYHMRHILSATREEAEAIRKELLAGADFAELAGARSMDPESASKGGDLGWVDTPRSVTGEEEASGLLAQKPGEFSPVLETERGFAVVEVLEMKKGTAPAFEAVKLQVARDLVIIKQKEIMEAFIMKLRSHAEIQVDEEALTRGAALLDRMAENRLATVPADGKPSRHP